MNKIAINGFGRIGRLAFRKMFESDNFEVAAINDLTDIKTLAHLLKYDSAQGVYYPNDISYDEKNIIVKGKSIPVYSEANPENLPWGELKIDIVIESTGFFTHKDKAHLHIQAGAKKVVISAPAQGGVKTIAYNVNHEDLETSDEIISAASCTTNCLAPVAHVLNKHYGIEKGFITTIHAATNDQRVVDAPHADLHRARSTLNNIIPTSTGAAAAVGLVLPDLNGKLDGIAMRVPLVTGSVVDLVVELKATPSVEEINSVFSKEANETLGYTEDPIVSVDVIGSDFGSVFDATQTSLISVDGRNLYKIIAWYDNEMSYVNQLIRTVNYFASI